MRRRAVVLAVALASAGCGGGGSDEAEPAGPTTETTEERLTLPEAAEVLASLAYGAGYSPDELAATQSFLARMAGACPEIGGPEAVADKMAGLASLVEERPGPEVFRGVMVAYEASVAEGRC